MEDLLPRRFKADDSTGQTPARRQTKVPQTLPVTRPKKDILKELRELGRVDVASEERAFDDDFAMTPDNSDDDSMHSAKQEYQAATVSSRTADMHPDANPFIATTVQDLIAEKDDLEDGSGLLSPVPCATKGSSQPTTRQDEQERENSVSNTASGIPTLFGANARPVRPGKGSHLFQQLKSERGDRKFSGVGSLLSSKRPHSDLDESEANNVTPNSILTNTSDSPASSAVSGIAEITNITSSTSTLAGVSAQKIAGAASTFGGPPPSSSTKPSIFSFGSGKTGATNGSEGPRKISRPVAKKPSFR